MSFTRTNYWQLALSETEQPPGPVPGTHSGYLLVIPAEFPLPIAHCRNQDGVFPAPALIAHADHFHCTEPSGTGTEAQVLAWAGGPLKPVGLSGIIPLAWRAFPRPVRTCWLSPRTQSRRLLPLRSDSGKSCSTATFQTRGPPKARLIVACCRSPTQASLSAPPTSPRTQALRLPFPFAAQGQGRSG
jgi:hypothetical protein